MNLAAKLNVERTDLETKMSEVSEEILSYFKEIFESGKFERTLYKNLSDQDKIKRKRTLIVEFWAYSSGCSDTNFWAGFFRWENPTATGYESYYYKGVDLRNIQRTVGQRLLNLTEYYLKEMGFKVLVENNECWLKNYSKKITIRW